MTKQQLKKIKQLTPLIKAIKDRCLDCSAGSIYEVEMCPCENCPLYPYRRGLNNPKKKTTRGKSQDNLKDTPDGGFQ